MNILLQTTLVGMVLVGAGCSLLTSKEATYLQSAQNRASREEVLQQLGPPKRVVTTETGEAVWLYEIRDLEPGAQDTWSTKGSWCDEYVLSFDATGVLRTWTHQSQFHGGETMPLVCIRNAVPQS